MIQEIKKEMKDWYLFELTDEQIQEFLDTQKEKDYFDTYEREEFAYYLSKKIVGMHWPMNMDSEEYKEKFCKALVENAPKLGYKLNFC